MTRLENKSLKDDSMNSQEDSQQSTNLNSKKSLIRRLKKGRDTRTRFVESHLNKKLAFQIRSLRGDTSQQKMEEITGIRQQSLSRLENPYYGKATLTTLKKIAAFHDVGLLVEFVPFSQLINRVSGTPYIEHGFSPDTMNVPSFDNEEQRGIFTPHNDIASLLDQSEQPGSGDGVEGASQRGTETEMQFDLQDTEQRKWQRKKESLPSRPEGFGGPNFKIYSMGGTS
jgi:hypothetical protein